MFSKPSVMTSPTRQAELCSPPVLPGYSSVALPVLFHQWPVCLPEKLGLGKLCGQWPPGNPLCGTCSLNTEAILSHEVFLPLVSRPTSKLAQILGPTS